MSETIVVAIIGLLGSAFGSLIGILTCSKLTQYRLEQLEKKVQAHNNLIERTYKLEDKSNILELEIRNTNLRIDDIERGV